jgi:DNA uptake protein ComE-like DNA-binding protein
MKERLEEAAQQKTPNVGVCTGQVVTPAASAQQEDTSSITSTLDGTVESRISSLESATEQTNRMIQDMMKMMQSFTKPEEKKGPSEKQQQTKEVVTTTDQYNAKTSRDEEQE